MTVLIAGGGVAGAAAACLLGSRATLVEREPGPHDKVCGAFISWEAQDALAQLGVDPLALGAAPIHAVRLVHGTTAVRAGLPRPGAGLSRRVLDEALLARAADAGAHLIRGHAVRRIVPSGLDVDSVGRLSANTVMLATGKHDLRGAKRRGRPDPLVGLKMAYRLTPAQATALDGHVEIVLFPGGYAGLQPIEGGLANLCLLIGHAAFEAAGSSWDGVAAHLVRHSPHLARRLDAAAAQATRPLAVFRMPYGFVHAPTAHDPPGVLRLGDQMGVIPSFSGDGMAIALHTAFAAVRAVRGSRAVSDSPPYHARMRRDVSAQIGRAMLLHRLGQRQPGLVAAAARAWPGALAWVARLTRVPAANLAWR